MAKTERFFLIVNPKGAMHVVSEEHARARLRIVGWRLATDTEKEAYKEAGGNQRFDEPLAAPWKPEPTLDDALPVAEEVQQASKKARTRQDSKAVVEPPKE